MESPLSTKKLPGNELHREISHREDPTIKLFVLRNQFTKNKHKIYDPTKKILTKEVFIESIKEAEEFIEKTIVEKYVEKHS